MKIKVSEATDIQLDWMVREAIGCNTEPLKTYKGNGRKWILAEGGFTVNYTTDWAQGGPIIERMIEDGYIIQKGEFGTGVKVMRFRGGDIECQFGHTPLIAAMRCFCVSKLGEEVEVPEELK